MDSYFANEARNIPSSSCHGMVQEIHVLLVDHDSESLMNTTKMLEMCSYRVTLAGSASAAISTFLSGKTKFDIVVADVNSPDFRAFELLYHAINMDLPVIFMSAEDDTHLAMRALENGAFLFFKKPATMEILRCLWQHVYRERARSGGNKERFHEMEEDKHGRRSRMGNMSPDHTLRGKRKDEEKFKGQKGDEDQQTRHDEYKLVIGDNSNKGVKRKVCMQWTDELHAKFVDAMAKLGEGRCFPKEILELMNVPGLKRMQVASHLQKCRINNRQALDKQRSPGHMFRDLNISPHKPMKFGSMPQLGRTQVFPKSAQVSATQPGNKIQNNFGNTGCVSSTMTHPSKNQASVQFEPGPSKTAHDNLHSRNDFFLFRAPVRPIRNFSNTLPQGSRTPDQTSGLVPSPYQHYQAYDHGQNSAIASVDLSSKDKQTLETSDAESDGSKAEDNIKSE